MPPRERGWTWLQRSNGSNVASAAVDSLVFPWIAFGGFQPVVTGLQFLAKVLGGAAWAWVCRVAPSNNEIKLTQGGSTRSEDVSSDEDLFDDIVGL